MSSAEPSTSEPPQNPYVAAISAQIDRVSSDVKLASDFYSLKDHPLRHYWLGAEFGVILIWAVGRSWIGARLKARGWGWTGRSLVRFCWSVSWAGVMVVLLPYLFFGSNLWHILARAGEFARAYLNASQAGG